MSTVPTKESLKEKAKLLSKFMKEKYNVDASHGHCIDLMSKVFGFNDWNTAAAALPARLNKKELPFKVETVGDMKKVLDLFADSDLIDGMYEFKISDLIEKLDEDDVEDGKISQQFSMSFETIDEDKEGPRFVSFKLDIEDEEVYTETEDGFVGKTLGLFK